MALFSERYGYIKPSDVIIRERLTPEIQNAICSCFDRLEACCVGSDFKALEKRVWMYFLNKRLECYIYSLLHGLQNGCSVNRHGNSTNLVGYLHQSSWVTRCIVNKQQHFKLNIFFLSTRSQQCA